MDCTYAKQFNLWIDITFNLLPGAQISIPVCITHNYPPFEKYYPM